MKVICINDTDCLGLISEGRIYEATQSHFPESYKIRGKEYYNHENGNRYSLSFFKSRFIPLSEIDETTFERKQNEIVVEGRLF